MALIADILLIAGALGATLYCHVLARRLRRFNDLEKGMGGAIAVLSAQVDDMTKVLHGAQSTARHSTDGLQSLTGRAEDVARRLELLVAAMHDLPPEVPRAAPPPAETTPAGPASASPPMAPAPPADAPPPAEAPAVLFRRRVPEAAE
ncbi:hypothetical protein [Rhodovulum steppense]|uniref:Uncharacterized protein n=1 Tax=Rhodovulum steppense TaxID=540251 RepID=A0A4R1Z0H4_9RHOB|nr:hypothetical protein [Rhodovulum steppense]TCM87070.1 hypothetical protein EV216_103148 [Rhodovulum steppense]